eukprot:scaffold108714_cov23-Tisochrysis_lutea.AAC.1
MAKTWVANILVQSTCVKCVLHAFTVGIASGQVLLAPDALLAAYCSVLFFVKQAQICNACHLGGNLEVTLGFPAGGEEVKIPLRCYVIAAVA